MSVLKHLWNLLCCFSLILFSLFSQAQVINAPYLHCVSVENNGDIQLDWGVPVNGCGPFNAYYIYRSQNSNGPYALVATILNQNQTSYVDPVGNGSTVTYYYYMESDFNCPGFTADQSDTLDNLDPVTPQINYVTVNGGLAEINWQPSTSPEAFGYIVYKVVGASYVALDTVYGKLNTDYIDLNSTPGTDTMSYTLATIDSCINTGLINEQPQHTVYLKDSVVRCNQSIILNWTPYQRWQKGVEEYDLYASVNGSLPSLLKTYAINISTDTVSGFNDGDLVCLTLVAKEKNSAFISTSNEICFTLNVVQPANDFYVRNVSVIAPGKIEVDWSVDPLADLLNISVQRAVDSISFTTLATFAPPANLAGINVYIDSTALTDQNSYYYRLIADDSCNIRDTSTVGQSVLLQGYAFSDLTYYIQWNASFLQYATVLNYDLYRNDGTGFFFLTTETPATLIYNEGPLATTTTPCYYIDAINAMSFPNGTVDTVHSLSNVLCLNQPSQIYMPNAFAPKGKNNIFAPILNVEGVKTFSFIVFDRWGEQIFSSENPTDGWDGKYNGVYVQQGAYAYVVDVTDSKGKHIQAKGTVMVVR